MKAKIKKTGEIIDVEPVGSLNCTVTVYQEKDGRKFPMCALEFEKGIDWEQRRYEIAKDMMAVIYLDDGQAERADDSDLGFEYKSDRHCAKEAVDFADALIEELKKRK